MPEWLHDKLARGARKKHLKGKRAAAYIYGTLAKYEEEVKSGKHKKKGVAKPGRH